MVESRCARERPTPSAGIGNAPGRGDQSLADESVEGPWHYGIATDTVRYQGEPVVLIVAESARLVEDAIDLVAVEYEPLPAIVKSEDALKNGTISLAILCDLVIIDVGITWDCKLEGFIRLVLGSEVH